MDQFELPADVQDFVLRYIDTVAELEGLLLAFGAPKKAWLASELGGRLYTSEPEAAAVLAALHGRGLLTRAHESFTFGPASPELERQVAQVAAAYPRCLIPLTRLIHAKPRQALRDFADAFRLRDKK
jgi:hypothetical protein